MGVIDFYSHIVRNCNKILFPARLNLQTLKAHYFIYFLDLNKLNDIYKNRKIENVKAN